MEYLPQVKVSKEDFLALSDLAGEMSIMDYMSKVIHEHVAAQQVRAADIDPLCPECHCELHLTTAGDHVCRNEACGSYR